MSHFEEVKSRTDEVTVINKNTKYPVELLGIRSDIKLKNSVKSSQCFVRQSSITVNLDNSGENGRGNRVVFSIFEGR